jgi:hypothetical protein
LANTQNLLDNEVDLAQKQKMMMGSLRDEHLRQKQEKDAMWPNKYGDLDPLPEVT